MLSLSCSSVGIAHSINNQHRGLLGGVLIALRRIEFYIYFASYKQGYITSQKSGCLGLQSMLQREHVKSDHSTVITQHEEKNSLLSKCPSGLEQRLKNTWYTSEDQINQPSKYTISYREYCFTYSKGNHLQWLFMIVKATSLVAGTWRVHVCPPVKGNESDIRSICRNAVKTPFYTLLTWERCPRRYTFIRRLEPSSALGASRLQAELK